MAQAVRRSPPTTGVPSSRLGHSMWVSWWTKRGLGSFSRGFSRFPLPQISLHHFSTLISSISFHFISPGDGASGVVGRHPCYSRTYNIGASSHLIPRPHLVLDTNWGYFIIIITAPNKKRVNVPDHGCANHATEGETLQSPIHCCDVTNPPYLFSGQLCTSTLHCKRLFVYTVCCRCGGQCFSVLRTRKSDVILT